MLAEIAASVLESALIRNVEHCMQIAAERDAWASLKHHYVRFCKQGEAPELKDETRTILRGLRGTTRR